MKLTKKLKKVMTLSVLGTAAVVLAGIASTKLIKTEMANLSGGKPDEIAGQQLEVTADASTISNELNNLEAAAKELEENANSLAKVTAKDAGFTTEPRYS